MPTTATQGQRAPLVLCTASMLLFAYGCLQIALSLGDGFYTSAALLLTLLSFGLCATAFWSAVRGGASDRRLPNDFMLLGVLVALLVVAWTRASVGYYIADKTIDADYRIWLIVVFAAAVVVYIALQGRWDMLRRGVFGALVLGAIVFRLWLPIAAPAPRVDVWTMGQQSVQNLLAGRNPYDTKITIVDYRLENPTQVFPGYVYPSPNLYLQAISYLLTHDVRYSSVVAEILSAGMIWGLARRRWRESAAELLTLLFLYQPRALFMIEEAWLDTLIVAGFALFLWVRDRDKPSLAAVVFGYTIALKQYMAFALVQWLIIERNWKRLAIGVGTAALAVAPFVLWNPQAFVNSGLLYTVALPFRSTSLTVYSFLNRQWGFWPPTGWSVIVGGVLTAVTFLPQQKIQPIRGFLFAVTVTTFGMFLFGSSGFYNWYYLVAGEMLLLLVVGGGRDKRWSPAGSGEEPLAGGASRQMDESGDGGTDEATDA